MKNIHFLHIRKAGGTAFKYALKDNLVTEKYIIHLHEHKYCLAEIPEEDLFIFFIRDPISRFISGFYSRQRQGQPRYYFPWSPQEARAFKQFKTPNQLALSLSSSDSNLRQAAVSAMANIRHINTSYYYWFDSKEYFLSRLNSLIFIGFQEHLASDFNILKEKLALSKNIKLPQDNIKAHRNIYPANSDLSFEAKRNLKMWYIRDYDFLRLCKDKAKEINDSKLDIK